MHAFTDLSAGVDVYSDWIDACDSVAKEAADAPAADDGFNSYQDLAAGNERRNSEMNMYAFFSEQKLPCLYRFQSRETRCKSNVP